MPFISTVTTLQQRAKEPAFLVIMINTLEPILMTTCFVQIPLFTITFPASIGFSTFVRDSACQTNKHEYGKKNQGKQNMQHRHSFIIYITSLLTFTVFTSWLIWTICLTDQKKGNSNNMPLIQQSANPA